MKNVVSSKKMGHLKNFKRENFKYDNNDVTEAKLNKKNTIPAPTNCKVLIGEETPKSTTRHQNLKYVFENTNI